MSKPGTTAAINAFILLTFSAPITVAAEKASQWFAWRGPNGDGVCHEKYSGWSFDEKPAWTFKMKGRGTPVIADGRMYVFGYMGDGQNVEETITCVDAGSGEQIWQHAFRDYISDTIYDRYSIGAAAIDPETRNVYLQTTNGLFLAFSGEGKILWRHSMMERFGRLTFPNGRTGAPIVEGDLVIMHCITSYWGKQGPARDRFYAFDKNSGEIVWVSEPGIAPKDSSFSTPVVESRYGTRVFYAGTGDGNLVCVNALNGKPLWRFHMSFGGVNSSPVIYGDTVICPHGKENIDTTEEGRMVAVKMPGKIDFAAKQAVLPATSEVWRNSTVSFTSSPTIVGDRIYQVSKVGELHCINAETGKILWHEKLGNDNLHSSPLYCDGKLYVPIFSGKFYIIEPSDKGAKILHALEFEGSLIGSPVISNGHLYLHTTRQLYCWKFKQSGITCPKWPVHSSGKVGKASELRVVPADVLLQPGQSRQLTFEKLDESGHIVGTSPSADFAKYIPPTAKVKAEMDASFSMSSKVSAGANAKASAGAWKGSDGKVGGIFRGRVLSSIPFAEDFESYKTVVDSKTDPGEKFAYPPLPWIGARLKWEVREVDGTKALRKTLDRVLFQRAMTFIGHPDLKNYTMQADVMTDGNRRIKSDVGLVNQRYLIVLKGNANQLEVNSNQERLKVAVPFPVKYKKWYTLKCRVDVDAKATATVRAKVWPRGEDEPGEWTIEVPHLKGHTQGAPGLFGFSPQSQKPVYVDNISITPSK
jgi:outer membrane protein assembly factor BamB